MVQKRLCVRNGLTNMLEYVGDSPSFVRKVPAGFPFDFERERIAVIP